MIQLKRINDTPSETDGLRILVDRLWPRGMTTKRAVATPFGGHKKSGFGHAKGLEALDHSTRVKNVCVALN